MWSDRYQTKSQPYSPSLCIILNSIILYGSVLSKGNIRETENIMRSTLLDAASYEIQFFCIYCWQLPFQFSTFTFVCLFPIPIFAFRFRFRFWFSFRTRAAAVGTGPEHYPSDIADNKLNAASFVHKRQKQTQVIELSLARA